MSYVQSVLQPGETIRHTASIHWVVYWPGALLILAALIIFGYGEFAGLEGAMHWAVRVLAGLCAAAGLFFLVPEWFTWWTTEIAVTNLRIIFKTGFISRKTIEMHMDKVESVDVEQSIMGRLLDYGTVSVRGVGTGFEPLKNIAAPLDLRNHVTGV
jgi:uncharacterized membrane protein YdbT with pleckstrin-like domain